MSEGDDAALADVLRRLDEGRDVTLAWLQTAYPRDWERLHQSLALLSWLEDDSDDADKEPGLRAGAWRLGEMLGRGAFGTTYAASHVDDPSREACVKVLHPELAARRDAVRQLLREARLGMSVRHPNVVRVLEADSGVFDGRRTAYLVMEWVHGRTLSDVLRDEGPLDDARCRRIGRQIAAGLDAIHSAGAVHRDLKPGNVLLAADDHAKVADLGVAWADDVVARAARLGGFAGTLRYAAPEQFAPAEQQADARADLFALGAVLFELLTGVPARPAAGASEAVVHAVTGEAARVRRLRPGVSAFLDALVERLLRPAPDDRFATAAEVAVVLQEGESSTWWSDRSRGRSDLILPQRLADALRTPLAGRDEELRQIEESLDALVHGTGSGWVLYGESGLGKTRLLAATAEAAHRRGLAVRAVRGATTPSDEWTEALAPGEPHVLLADDVAETPEDRRLELARALENAGSESRTVICAFRASSDDPWLVHVVSVCGAKELEIGRLEPDAARELVRRAAGGVAIADADVQSAVRAADGHPLALLYDVQRLVRTRIAETSVTRVETGAGAGIPRGVLDTVQRRLAALTRGDRELLECAACIGRRLLAGDASVASGRPTDEVEDDLRRLANAGALLVRDGSGFAFRHALVRNAVEALAPADVRRHAHLRLAERLSAEELAHPAWLAERVRHLVQAEAMDEARPHLLQAVRGLILTGRSRDALALCEDALADPGLDDESLRARIESLHGTSANYLGDLAVARELLDRAVDRARTTADAETLAFCLENLIRFADGTNEWDLAMASAEELLAIAERQDDDELRKHAHTWLGNATLRAGDPEATRRHLEEVDRLQAAAPSPWGRLAAPYNWFRFHNACGRWTDVLAACDALEPTARETGQQQLLRSLTLVRAQTLNSVGRLRDGVALLRQERDAARRECRAREVAEALRGLGVARGWCGDRDGALASIRTASDIDLRTGFFSSRAVAEAGQGAIESRLGDSRAGYRTIRAAWRSSRSQNQLSYRIWIAVELAFGAWRAGFRSSAGRIARAVLPQARRVRRRDAIPCLAAMDQLARGDTAASAATLRQHADALSLFPHLELAGFVAGVSGSDTDREHARVLARRFLDALPDDLADIARASCPEVFAALRQTDPEGDGES